MWNFEMDAANPVWKKVWTNIISVKLQCNTKTKLMIIVVQFIVLPKFSNYFYYFMIVWDKKLYGAEEKYIYQHGELVKRD